MSRLSPHFTIAEFVKSQTAERKGIDNTPTQDHIERMKILCVSVLEPIRTVADSAEWKVEKMITLEDFWN